MRNTCVKCDWHESRETWKLLYTCIRKIYNLKDIGGRTTINDEINKKVEKIYTSKVTALKISITSISPL